MPKRHVLSVLPALVVFVSSVIFPQAIKKDIDWKQWHFIIGEWIGEGGGTVGQGTGSFTFDFDLQKRVLVRKSVANFPATKDRPAFSHNDLMVIYKEPSNATNAMYFDDEGHVIKYSVNFSDDQSSIIFISVPEPNEPIYRQTYIKINNQKLNIKFEIAQPTSPSSFTTYLLATAHRK
jgi:hypothetical protein